MNILLTGVSKGLGLTIAQHLLSKGFAIYGISRSKSVKLGKLSEQYKDNLKWMSYNLKDSENIHQDIFKNWIGFDTPIHGFVNNAAYAYDDIITNLNHDSLTEMYKVNVFSPMMMTKSAIRHMILHRVKGSIIHLSSISVHTGYKGLAMYASSKGSLEAFSKNTAREWGEAGIRSNCIVAGFMETEMSASLAEDTKNRIYKRTSLKKPTEKDSVASTISFLLGVGSNSITGQNFFVDSGTI